MSSASIGAGVTLERHLAFLHEVGGVSEATPASANDQLNVLSYAVTGSAFKGGGLFWIPGDFVEQCVRPLFVEPPLYLEWAARAARVAAHRRGMCGADLPDGVWYTMDSVLAVTTHPKAWFPSTETVVHAFSYGKGGHVTFLYTMHRPGEGCEGDAEFVEAWAAVRSEMDKFPCNRCAENRKNLGLLVDARGPVLLRTLSGLPPAHPTLRAVGRAQLAMLRTAVFEVQVVAASGHGFVPVSAEPGTAPFGGASLFCASPAGGTTFPGLDLDETTGTFVITATPVTHARIAGVQVFRGPVACPALLACASFVRLHEAVGLCASVGYDVVRGASQMTRRLVDALAKFKFEGKPGSAELQAQVHRTILNLFHAWARDANRTSFIAATSAGGAPPPPGAASEANDAAEQFCAGVEWRNPPTHAHLPTFDLDMQSWFMPDDDSGRGPFLIFYPDQFRHFCAHANCCRYLTHAAAARTGCAIHGTDYTISHVEDQQHPIGQGRETMRFGPRVAGFLLFAVCNFSSLAYAGEGSADVPPHVTCKLTISVGGKSVASSVYMVPRNPDQRTMLTFVPDVAARLAAEMDRVALLREGGGGGYGAGGGAKVADSGAPVEIRAVNTEELKRVMREQKLGVLLPLSPVSLDPAAKYMSARDSEKAAARVREAFGSLSAETVPMDGLPGAVWDVRSGFAGATAPADLPLELVEALEKATSGLAVVTVPLTGQRVFPAVPVRFMCSAVKPVIPFRPVDYAEFGTMGEPPSDGRQHCTPKQATGQYDQGTWAPQVAMTSSGSDGNGLHAYVECVARVPDVEGAFFIGFRKTPGGLCSRVDSVTGTAAAGACGDAGSFSPPGYNLRNAPVRILADHVRAKLPAAAGSRALSHALQHQLAPLYVRAGTLFGMMLRPGQELVYAVWPGGPGGEHMGDRAGHGPINEHVWSTSRPEVPSLDAYCRSEATETEAGLAGAGSFDHHVRVQHGRDYNEAARLLEQAKSAVGGSEHVQVLRALPRAIQEGRAVPTALAMRSAVVVGHALQTYLNPGDDGGAGGGGGGGGAGGSAAAPRVSLKPAGMPMHVWTQVQAANRAKARNALEASVRTAKQIVDRQKTMEALLRTTAAALERDVRAGYLDRREKMEHALQLTQDRLAELVKQKASAEREGLQMAGKVKADDLSCPITTDVMVNPVVMMRSGQTYEQEAIDEWIAAGNMTDPLTREPLGPKPYYVTNFALLKLCREYTEAVQRRSSAGPSDAGQMS